MGLRSANPPPVFLLSFIIYVCQDGSVHVLSEVPGERGGAGVPRDGGVRVRPQAPQEGEEEGPEGHTPCLWGRAPCCREGRKEIRPAKNCYEDRQ